MVDPYVWSGSTVLRNLAGITDQQTLDIVERETVLQRLREGCPSGAFDRQHLQAIHHHLFQDMYEWAGQVRTLNISKGVSHFIPHQYIDTGLADVHQRLEAANCLRGLDADRFAAQAGEIIGDVNYVHPFREGNGRTQIEYLRQLGAQAGHMIELKAFDRDRWIEASVLANAGTYAPMAEEIRMAIVSDRERQRVDEAAERERVAQAYRERMEAARSAHRERGDRDRER